MPKGASFFHQWPKNWAHIKALLPILVSGHEGKLFDHMEVGTSYSTSGIRSAVITYTQSYRSWHSMLGGCTCKHKQLSAQALQLRFFWAESAQPVCLVSPLLPYNVRLPQSEFVIMLLKYCSQYESPDMRENTMVPNRKGVGNMEVCFNRKTPKHWARSLILLWINAVALLFLCRKDTVTGGLLQREALHGRSSLSLCLLWLG